MSNIKKRYEIMKDGAGLYSVSQMAHQVLNPNSENNMVDAFSSTESSVNILMKKCRIMVENAKKESMKTADEAYKKGYNKAYSESFENSRVEASEKSAEKNTSAVAEINEVIKKLSKEFEEKSKKDENLLKALELAKAVIKTELQENDEAYIGLYKKAANHISSISKATLITTERGKEIYEKNKGKFLDAIDGLEELNVKTQSGKSGLCILETELGSVDSSAQSQFERAKNIIMPQS